jgi:predicted transcriptional regulator of viral defense system
MKSNDFLAKLKLLKKPVFQINDISRILSKDEKYTRVFLKRIENKGLLKRIERGKYAFEDENPFLIASNLIFPAYISFISALSYYSLTTQIPKDIFIVSLRQKKELSNIKFIKFNKKRFFGYKKEKINEKFLFIGEIEKVIADSLFLPKYCPLSEVLFALKNAELSNEKLISYSSKMSRVAMKRLGYLIELANKEISIKVDFKYDLLNPALGLKGEKNKKWKLIINEVL